MRDLKLLADLFLCPVEFDGIKSALLKRLNVRDYKLHFTPRSAAMSVNGADIYLLDSLPEKYAPAKAANKNVMRFRTIKNPNNGQEYIPLFISYQSMIQVFGENIAVGVVSFMDIMPEAADEAQISGIVVGPGIINKIMSKKELAGYKVYMNS